MTFALGIDSFQRENFIPATLNSFVAENVALITKMETDYLSDVFTAVHRGVRAGESVRSIAKTIEKRTDVSKSRARFIARDQIGKLNGQLTELRQTNLGIEKYTWRTSEDERVRPSHRAHNGRMYSWSDPPSGTGNPGDDFQCRCYAEPDFSSILSDV
ncbi:MAG: minor capsid protein [Scytonema sp. CRU_2_7]|nr:minor capsid protein [Scytonema sp. CRU_2_7]